jgi:hypothetical protein
MAYAHDAQKMAKKANFLPRESGARELVTRERRTSLRIRWPLAVGHDGYESEQNATFLARKSGRSIKKEGENIPCSMSSKADI